MLYLDEDIKSITSKTFCKILKDLKEVPDGLRFVGFQKSGAVINMSSVDYIKECKAKETRVSNDTRD